MRSALLGVLLLSALPLLAQEPAPEEKPPRLVAAAWCPVRTGAPADEDVIGCDAGVGAALVRWHRAFLAGVVGSKTVGFGLGWTAYRGPSMIVAVAAGIVAPYDEQGVRADGAALALGCTFSPGRP
jgi:hypothetical protein